MGRNFMWTRQKRRSNKSRFILPMLTVLVLGYFSYHIFNGEYGLYSREKVEKHITLLNDELSKLKVERETIEERVALLRDGSIEKDMLDEYVRRNLNMSKPNELTILTEKDRSKN